MTPFKLQGGATQKFASAAVRQVSNYLNHFARKTNLKGRVKKVYNLWAYELLL